MPTAEELLKEESELDKEIAELKNKEKQSNAQSNELTAETQVAPEQNEPSPEAPEVEATQQPEPESEDIQPLEPSTDEKALDPEYWRARANSINGEYQKLKKQRKEDMEKLNALEQEVDAVKQFQSSSAGLNQQADEAQPQNTLPTEVGVGDFKIDLDEVDADKLEEIFGEEVIEDYGEDLPKVIYQTAKKMAENMVKPLEQKLDQNAQEIEQTSSENAFWDSVHRVVPNARSINENDEGWDIWLKEPVPNTGMTRKQIAQNAIAEGNTELVASFFKQYKQSAGVSSKPSMSQESVASQIVPNASAQNPNGMSKSGGKKPVYKTSQIDKFYEDAANGMYKNNPQKYELIDAQITQAQKEGRIVKG